MKESFVKFFKWLFGRSSFFFALVFWAIALVLGAIMVNWFVLPVIAGQFAETMPVPNVVGIPIEEAEGILTKVGLNVKWASEGRYSDKIPEKHTLIQVPAAGRSVKNGRTVFLTVSLGKREVTIPDLRGKSQRQAEISMQRLGLFIGEKIEGAHTEMPRDVVIRTEPPAGVKVRVGTKVDLIISSGKSAGKILLPNLKGLSLDKAKNTIESLGFLVGNVATIDVPDKLPNTVLDQNPNYGEYIELETKIDLTVAE